MLCPIVQSVASLIADPLVVSSISALSHTFVEIDCETFSLVILFHPLDSRRAVDSNKGKYVP